MFSFGFWRVVTCKPRVLNKPRGKCLSDLKKGKILANCENDLTVHEIATWNKKTGGPKNKLSDRTKRAIIRTASTKELKADKERTVY